MNKQELSKKIKSLVGLEQEEKAWLLETINVSKKYGLIWEDKPEDVERSLEEMIPVLREVKENALVNGTECPNHILIEGDNLHALTALSFTHESTVDIAYFDPPYNTGEDDFKYNDKYIDKENGFRHSMWLSFISKRLRIMKRLLSPSGVAIIHIDENEFDTLNLLLQTEIFTEGDFLGCIIWNKRNPKGDAKEVATMHEYVLVFAKNKEEFLKLENPLRRKKPNALAIIRKAKNLFSKIGKRAIPDEIKEVIKPFNYPKEVLKDFEVTYDLELVNREFQAWIGKQQDFSEGEKAYKFIDENGDVFQTVSMAWPNKEVAPDDYWIPLNHPLNNRPCPLPERGWRNPSSTMSKLLGNKPPVVLSDGMVVKGSITFTVNKKGENNQPRSKYLLKENLTENTPSIFNNGTSDDGFFSKIGMEFPYAKPVEVARYLLESIHPCPKVILDFFAGSGTTLHAILELESERQSGITGIIVTNNEVDRKMTGVMLKKGIHEHTQEFQAEGICRKITYPRLSKVIMGYQTKDGDSILGLKGNNLRYYRCDFLPRTPSLKNKRELTKSATDLLCIKEGCYTEVNLSVPKNELRMFQKGEKQLMVVYDDQSIGKAVEMIKALEATHTKVYVFSIGSDPYTDDFAEVQDKVELCALPDAIYKAYQHVLPKRKAAPPPGPSDNSGQQLKLIEA